MVTISAIVTMLHMITLHENIFRKEIKGVVMVIIYNVTYDRNAQV